MSKCIHNSEFVPNPVDWMRDVVFYKYILGCGKCEGKRGIFVGDNQLAAII